MRLAKLPLLLALTMLLVIPVFAGASAHNDQLAVRAKPDNPGGGHGKPGGGSGGSGGSSITGQKYALVIGISDYQGTSNDLQYADDDARDWNNYLKSQGFQTKLLLDSQADKASILAGLQWLADMEDEPGDAVAITYSGHGYYSNQEKQSMFIAWELVGVYTSEIEAITDTFESQHVFFFDDACNQGTMSDLVNAGWVAAIGSTTHSYTYDGDSSMQNGIFTWYAMEAISMGMNTAETICSYAVDMFNQNTPGHATLYDSFSGDQYFN